MTERLRLGRALLLPSLVAFILLFVLATGARAAWRAVGDVKSVERTRGGVVLVLTSGARVTLVLRYGTSSRRLGDVMSVIPPMSPK